MPVAPRVVTLQGFEPNSRADESIRVRGFGARVLDWVMKTQKQRAESLVQQHPEWLPVE